MRDDARVAVVIPALNEAALIGRVLQAIPEWVDRVVVADNGSTDGTPEVASRHGATVVYAARRGYGSACLAGIAEIQRDPPDIVVFLDADFSDDPAQMPDLVDPIARGEADFVVGSRVLGRRERGALSPQSRWGNSLACALIRLLWGARMTDLGPFRAIRYSALQRLDMQDPDYGWTVEMQLKAVSGRIEYLEVPVDYRRRAVGRSKVSGTLRGVMGAGYKILRWIGLHAVRYATRRTDRGEARRLLVFTRFPEPGAAKSRLIPALGESGAAELHRALAEHTLAEAKRFGAAGVEVHYTGGDADRMRAWLGGSTLLHPQQGGDLGERMAHAFDRAFTGGADHVLLVGTDCPDLDMATYRAAYEALRGQDLVLGPATDGGYYLIGVRKTAWPRARTLFSGVAWGTDGVLRETLARAAEANLASRTLAPLRDVDKATELEVWERYSDRDRQRPSISIVVPTFNAGDRFADVMAGIGNRPGIEVIVVDADSEDGTREIAAQFGARVLDGPRGRAQQMNYGSAFANADTVLFLHSDTIPPDTLIEDIPRTLSGPGVVAGAFRFSTDFNSALMRKMEAFTNFRARCLQLPYGDQGIFLRIRDFRRLGGFRDLPIMDDFEFIRRARRLGRIACAESSAVTSGARWRQLGIWRTTLRNQAVVAMYYLGVPADRLAQFYRRRAS